MTQRRAASEKAGARGERAATKALLHLRGFGVAFGERIVLSGVDLDVPAVGCVVLMGPSGTGKSTLLRTLAGCNVTNPSMRTWGNAQYDGRELADGAVERPGLVSQSLRLMLASVLENVANGLPNRHLLTPLEQRATARRLLVDGGMPDLAADLDRCVVELTLGQQRQLAILRACATDASLVCVDEPTADLDEDQAAPLIALLRRESRRRALLVVVHNQRQARALGGTVALLAGGWIHEAQPAEQFFSTPASDAGREFTRNGTCAVPSPGARPDELDDSQRARVARLPAAARRHRSAASGPRGFLWVRKGVLAGTPWPGIVSDVQYDLEALQRVGITRLVSLTEQPFPAHELERHGMLGFWFPIEDMRAPGVEQAIGFCGHIAQMCGSGEIVALHCKAGLGRTGMMLAAQLIYDGASALEALEAVRRIEPKYVQSDEQVKFLEDFAIAARARDSGGGGRGETAQFQPSTQ